jgi:hypothetical protein
MNINFVVVQIACCLCYLVYVKHRNVLRCENDIFRRKVAVRFVCPVVQTRIKQSVQKFF